MVGGLLSGHRAGFVLVALLMRPISGWLSDRFGPVWLFVGVFAVVTAGAAAHVFAPGSMVSATTAFLSRAAALEDLAESVVSGDVQVGDALVRPVVVVEVFELAQRMQQVTLVPHLGAVEQFAATDLNAAFHDRVHPGYPDVGEHDMACSITANRYIGGPDKV